VLDAVIDPGIVVLQVDMMIRGTSSNLRAADRTDLDRISAWLDDPELMRAWGYGAPAVSRSSVARRIEEWIADEQALDHPVALIVETLTGQACGLILLSRISAIDRSCELSLFLEEEKRGQGIGTDLMETILDAVFEQWNYHRIMVYSEDHNVRAHAFFARNLFELEGRMRQARYLDGEWHDVLVFGRVRGAGEAAR